MSLTFTNWVNCTDGSTGQVFALNWTADTGLVPVDCHFEALRQAIVERYSAAGLTLSGILTTPVSVSALNSYDYGIVIDAAITALIQAYVNHTDNGGNWQGQTVCAPAWTEAAILTAIGAASRITVGNLGTPLSAAWARQVYALLGMMRWIKKYRDYYVPGGLTCINLHNQLGAGSKPTIQQAVDEAISNLSDDVNNFFPAAATYINAGYNAAAIRRWGQFQTSSLPLISRTCDVYAMLGYRQDMQITDPPSGLWGPLAYYEFDSNGRGYTVCRYNLLETVASHNTATTTSGIFDLSSESPPKYPSLPGGFTAGSKMWFTNHYHFVLKWAISGGFTFQ